MLVPGRGAQGLPCKAGSVEVLSKGAGRGHGCQGNRHEVPSLSFPPGTRAAPSSQQTINTNPPPMTWGSFHFNTHIGPGVSDMGVQEWTGLRFRLQKHVQKITHTHTPPTIIVRWRVVSAPRDVPPKWPGRQGRTASI